MSNSKLKNKLFKGNTPKAPVELTKNADGVIIGARRVQHIRTVNGRQYVYNPTKGWKKVPEYKTHYLLNKLFVNSGLGTIYSDEVLRKAYGI